MVGTLRRPIDILDLSWHVLSPEIAPVSWGLTDCSDIMFKVKNKLGCRRSIQPCAGGLPSMTHGAVHNESSVNTLC